MKRLILIFLLFTTPCFGAVSTVQSKELTDYSTNNSPAVTLDSTATSGNLIFTCLGVDKSAGTITVPTGFTEINQYVSSSVSGACAFKVSAGTESTITWTTTDATPPRQDVIAIEYSGLTAAPLDVKAENDSSTSAVTSLSSGTTGTTAQNDEYALAFFTIDSDQNMTNRSYTNSFVERFYTGDESGGNAPCVIADKTLTATGTVETTASWDTGDQTYGLVAVFKIAADTRRRMILLRR